MEHFYVVTNRQKDKDLLVTKKIRAYLESRGKSCVIQDEEQLSRACTDASQIPDNTECILVLGGDGTMIQAARDVVNRDIPLFGINLGTLGYLTEADAQNFEPALDALLADCFSIDNRMMLDGEVRYQDDRRLQALALNDVVIARYGNLRILDYRIFVNGEHLYTYGADGIVISTPTGSTGYSLSAGGPIVSPKASMILITPICAHTLNSRSIVLSPEDEITVEIAPGRAHAVEHAAVTLDGAQSFVLSSGDCVTITKSKKSTKIIKVRKESFLEILSKKISE